MPTVHLEDSYGQTKKAIFKGLMAYNRSQVGKQKWKQIAVSVRDEDGAIVGGVCGEAWGGYLFVVGVWLDERFRGLDHASKAMDMLEDQAKAFGARRAYVDTFSFQARPFYEKRGYRVFGELDGFFGDHRRYWLTKDL